MKFIIDWLKDFVSIPWSRETLAHRLTMAGFEVEGEEVGITPNRGDCLSILGLAREISALQGKPLRFKKTPPSKGEKAVKNFIQVQVLDKKGCSRYMARAVLGVKIQPSPEWLQKRLTQAGVRPINNVVDCTNYVMLELGHPLHAFDHRFLRGQKIIVRAAGEPTTFTTLDGQTQRCEANDLFICDAQGPVALAGIMGGANSEVREDTTNIVLEAACFNPKRIHATAKRLKLKSESSYRFERGVDPNGVENALHRVVELIVKTAGGTPTKGWIDVYPKKVSPSTITLEIQEVERHLGLKLSPTQIKRFLESLGFEVKGDVKRLKVKIPTYRLDISRGIDLAEEIARLYGYDKIPATQPKIQSSVSQKPLTFDFLKKTTDCLLGLGFHEGCHLSFCALEEAKIFASNLQTIVTLENPLSSDQSYLRPSLIPGLLKAAAFNAHRQVSDLKLFELQKVFSWKGDNVHEERHLGLIAFGEEWPIQWQLPQKAVDFFSLKGVLDSIAPLEYRPHDLPSFLVLSMAATVLFKENVVGWVGLIHPEIVQKWDMKLPIFAAELNWEACAKEDQNNPRQFAQLSKFPFVERDIALVVDQSLPVKRIEEAIWATNKGWIQKVQVFDLYKGKELPPDKKSFAFHIRYASKERTLTNEEVNKAHETLVAHLEKTIPAKLR